MAVELESMVSRADSLYIDGDYQETIRIYTEALNHQQQNNDDDDATFLFRSYSHRSGAHYKCQNYEQSYQDAKQAVTILMKEQQLQSLSSLRPSQREAVYGRLGRAAIQLKHYEEAIRAFTTALQFRNQSSTSGTKQDVVAKEYENNIKICESKLCSSMTTVVDQKPPPASSSSRPNMPKYQYYQNDSFMTISILESNVKSEDLEVKFSKQHLSIILHKQGVDFTVCHGHLYEKVNVEKCKIKIMDEKVLIKLKKIEDFTWHELFGAAKNDEEEEENGDKNNNDKSATNISNKVATDSNDKEQSSITATNSQKSPDHNTKKTIPVRPYASHRDWNAIERDLKKQEAKEKPEGDEALNKLFKDIYAGANEDTRRAMIKSFQTSGGTCLSTNWDEVSKKDYEKERQAPKGMEWKDYEGQRLPQKDDD